MSTEEQLRELLAATEVAFNRSQVKRDADKAHKKWMYNVAATRIIPQNPLILGFNWRKKRCQESFRCQMND